MAQDFTQLSVWKLSYELCCDIYKSTKLFPSEEKFGLTNQIRRAAVSIPANIAEGSGRKTPKDFYHFLSMSQGSINEVITMLMLARDLKYISNEYWKYLDKQCNTIGKMITNLQKSISSQHL